MNVGESGMHLRVKDTMQELPRLSLIANSPRHCDSASVS